MAGGGRSTSTTNPSIPEELKPLANLFVSRATDLANTPFQAFQGQRFAGLNDTQNTALKQITDRATGGSQTFNNAENALNGIIQGGQTNPFLDSLVSRAQNSVVQSFNNTTKPQTESAAVRSGSFGNSGLDETLQNQRVAVGDQLGNIATQIFGNAFNTDRANQLAGIQLAPGFANQAFSDAGQLLNAGNLQQSNAQRPLDFNFQQSQDAANDPFKKLQAIGGVVGQSSGSTTTQSGGGK